MSTNVHFCPMDYKKLACYPKSVKNCKPIATPFWGGFFDGKMDGEKYLYCPQKIRGMECSKKICRIGQGKFHRSFYVKCPKCKSMIHYNAETEEADVSDFVYERQHSSGKRFY